MESIRRWSRRWLLLPAFLVPTLMWPEPAHAVSVFEDFEGAGPGFSNTLFRDIEDIGGMFSVDVLNAAQGVPDEIPPLPANAGGDQEGRYAEIEISATASYALTPPALAIEGGMIDGYVGFGGEANSGSKGGGFALGMNRLTTQRFVGYVAMLTPFFSFGSGWSNATFHIGYRSTGVTTTLEGSAPFPVDWDAENFHIAFSADGDQLEASLWRVLSDGTNVLETPIDLFSTAGVQNSLVAQALTSSVTGQSGLVAFARGDQSVLFDDVWLTVPEPAAAVLIATGLLALGTWSWTQARYRRPSD